MAIDYSGAAASGIQGLFDIGGQFLSNYFSKNASKRQFKYNMWMWKEMNEYNKPINQMKRLREAGLNPNLVYGHGANALTSSPSPVSQQRTPDFKVDLLGALKTYQDMEQTDAMTQNIKAQKLSYTAQALSSVAKALSDWKDWDAYDKTGANPARSVPQQAVSFIVNGIRNLAEPVTNWAGDFYTDMNYPYGAKGARKNPLMEP